MGCCNFLVEFSELDQKLPVSFEENIILNTDGEYYEGEYEVIPKTEAQTMETKGLLMSDDVTITAIPYFEVSNIQGGQTVWIGEMNNGN